MKQFVEGFYAFKSFNLILYSMALTPIIAFIETYLFQDWQFLKFLLILIVLDTVLGLINSWKKRQVSSYGFGKLITKLVLYLFFLVLIHVLCHFTVAGAQTHLFDWLNTLACSAIMLRESISILENLALINKKIIPTWVLDRLKKVEDNSKEIIKNTPKTLE
jgi:toxin secretion/phage lysis holin